MSIATGHDHLKNLSLAGEATVASSTAVLEESSDEVALIGVALSALFQAATCYRSCSGGPHILEALAGRSYNLAAAAYTVITRGFYDEGYFSFGASAKLPT